EAGVQLGNQDVADRVALRRPVEAHLRDRTIDGDGQEVEFLQHGGCLDWRSAGAEQIVISIKYLSAVGTWYKPQGALRRRIYLARTSLPGKCMNHQDLIAIDIHTHAE